MEESEERRGWIKVRKNPADLTNANLCNCHFITEEVIRCLRGSRLEASLLWISLLHLFDFRFSCPWIFTHHSSSGSSLSLILCQDEIIGTQVFNPSPNPYPHPLHSSLIFIFWKKERTNEDLHRTRQRADIKDALPPLTSPNPTPVFHIYL